MNIYLISQTKNNAYDTYDAAVVCAESEEEARKMRPTNDMPDDWVKYDWAEPEYVQVKLLGTAADGVTGVLLASFIAG